MARSTTVSGPMWAEPVRVVDDGSDERTVIAKAARENGGEEFHGDQRSKFEGSALGRGSCGDMPLANLTGCGSSESKILWAGNCPPSARLTRT